MPKRILETYDLDAAIKKNRYLELVGREVYWRSIEVIGRRVSWQKDIIVGIVTFLTTGKLALEVELVCAICHIASEKHLLVQDLRDNIWCHVVTKDGIYQSDLRTQAFYCEPCSKAKF